ncbi:MAG: hypothetical protein KF867_05475 [Cryobacterium sp.]|nr:hypothetical protein [Cryobacterium sp.]
MMKFSPLVLLGAIVGVILTGCTSSPPPKAVPSATPAVFDGTPREYSVLWRACLDDLGFVTTDLSPSDPGYGIGFGVSIEGHTDEELDTANKRCRAELGEPKMQDLSDSELRERYETRLQQFECLLDNGMIEGDPPTFETFVSDYNRSGQKELWQPALHATSIERDGVMYGASDICPESADVW